MSDQTTSSSRRDFLRVSAIGLAGASLPIAATDGTRPALGVLSFEVPPFELEELSIADLRKRLESGQDTARSLVEKYLARIEALDRKGPALHHVIEINPDALQAAEALDAERKAGRMRGPLHGIPVAHQGQHRHRRPHDDDRPGRWRSRGRFRPRTRSSCGSCARPARSSSAKTNLSEWANFRSTHSSSGWSGRGGQGKNPYALDRNPSGSSSGTGGAVAASYAAVGIGTETDGSIVSPSNNCGLVGIKPTLGLVSRAGIIPIAHSQDTAGPMARTVTDAAILLGALVGADPDDAITRNALQRGVRDYTKSLDPNGLKGARIGVPRKAMFDQSPHGDRVAEEAIDVLKRLGAVIVDPADLPSPDKFGKSEFEVLLYEFKADLNAYLAGLGPEGARAHAEGPHRLQRSAQGPRDAVLRPGDLRAGAGKGAAHRRQVQDGALHVPAVVAHPRYRRGDDQVPSRRLRRSHVLAGDADRPGQWRLRPGRRLELCRR